MGLLSNSTRQPIDLRALYFNTPPPQTLRAAPAPTFAEKLADYVTRAAQKAGVKPRSAGMFGRRASAAVEALTPFGAATEAQQAKRSFGSGNYGAAAGHALGALLSAMPDGGAVLGKGLLHSIIAPLYHGSPHKFEKFALEHIGTGEGNQMYGHGLYFAENPAVASTYAIPRGAETKGVPEAIRDRLRGALGSNDYLGFDTFGRAINAVRQHRLDFEKRWEVNNADEIRAALQDYDAHRFAPNQTPTLYTVSANANPSDFADYDALGPSAERIARVNGMAGVRYLDQGSRTAGQGTHNYVVFDPSIIDILNRH